MFAGIYYLNDGRRRCAELVVRALPSLAKEGTGVA
jgi:hypothetical protein